MPTYEHQCTDCNWEWEEVYGMNDPIPSACPNCKVEGKVKRLISGGSGKGHVELTGQELKAHIKAEAEDWKRKASKDEKFLANLVGDGKYQQNVVDRERVMKEYRPKIRTRK